jgi:hypothetical protein
MKERFCSHFVQKGARRMQQLHTISLQSANKLPGDPLLGQSLLPKAGMVPLNMLLKKKASVMDVHFETSWGTDPTIWLLEISKAMRPVHNPMEDGSEPTNWLPRALKFVRPVHKPTSAGMVPIKPLNGRKSVTIFPLQTIPVQEHSLLLLNQDVAVPFPVLNTKAR